LKAKGRLGSNQEYGWWRFVNKGDNWAAATKDVETSMALARVVP